MNKKEALETIEKMEKIQSLEDAKAFTEEIGKNYNTFEFFTLLSEDKELNEKFVKIATKLSTILGRDQLDKEECKCESKTCKSHQGKTN